MTDITCRLKPLQQRLKQKENAFAALGKLPGSEGNHSQTAKHKQYSITVIGDLAPSCAAVMQ